MDPGGWHPDDSKAVFNIDHLADIGKDKEENYEKPMTVITRKQR